MMLTFASSGSARNITYDANGNMASVTNTCGTTTYSWDARNRLVGITGFKPDCSLLTASFLYDAVGRRVQKTINGQTIQYLYDGVDIIQEITNGLPSVNYIRTLNIDEPLARIDLATNTVRYYHADALGSIIGLSNESGQEVTKYAYDPFGQVVISGEMSDNPFQYTGRENDGTGLYYYRARYYSSELQRFVSEDPIGLKGGINFFAYVDSVGKGTVDTNLYVYADNSPINENDPMGLQPGIPGLPCLLGYCAFKDMLGRFSRICMSLSNNECALMPFSIPLMGRMNDGTYLGLFIKICKDCKGKCHTSLFFGPAVTSGNGNDG